MNWFRNFFRSKKRKKVFISYSSNDGEFAMHLDSWLRQELGVETFCTARPGAITEGTNWYYKIVEEASGVDECLLLLNPESFLKGWIHFEAGVVMGASLQEIGASKVSSKDLNARVHKIIPALYGGIRTKHVPANLKYFQCLDLIDEGEFNSFARRLLPASEKTRNFHAEFLGAMTDAVKHKLYHGASTLLQPWDKVRTEPRGALTFTSEGQTTVIPRNSGGEYLAAVRLKFVPRATPGHVHWKFGVRLVNGEGARVFEFHAGCHDGQESWSLYSQLWQQVPISIPCHLATEQASSIQLSISNDGQYASCIGVDSRERRQIVLNQEEERRWRLSDRNWTHVEIRGWADGRQYRVDLDGLEIDWTS